MREQVKAPPEFNLSNVSDDVDGETARKETMMESRHVGSRPITVGDLEARPGSPSMLFVAGSESGGSLQQTEEKAARVERQPSEPPVNRPPATLPSLSLDAAWKQPGAFSLDNAWKTKDPTAEREEERRREEKERWREEQYREEPQRREEERQRQEEEEERERREEEEEEASAQAGEADKGDDTGGIDPIMLQYMAKVQAMKEQENQGAKPSAKVSVKTQQETPSQSEEVSVVDDGAKSNHEGDDDFSW